MNPEGRKHLFWIIPVLIIFISFVIVFIFKHKSTSNALSGNVQILSDTAWSTGNKTNIQIDNGIKIDNKNKQKINIAGATATATSGGSLECLFDESPFECWAVESYRNPSATVTIDLGSIKTGVTFAGITIVQVSSDYNLAISSSIDNNSYTSFYNNDFISGQDVLAPTGPNTNIRYYKVQITFNPNGTGSQSGGTCLPAPDPLEESDIGCGFQFAEFEIYSDGIATHTSSSSQLDGTENFTAWTTFEPDATIPANTAVNFRFRTSNNGVDWTTWSSSTAYAGSIDISGLDQRRYLQVETTLSNTDGASTPTLNSYTANYTYSEAQPCDNYDHSTITPTSLSLSAGESANLTAKAYDASNNELSGITYSWSASGGSIDAFGNYTAPTVPGSYTVTANSSCPGGSSSINVDVRSSSDDPDPDDPNPKIIPDGPISEYTAEISPTTFNLDSGKTQKLSVIFKDKNGNIVDKNNVGKLTPDYDSGKSFFTIASGGGILSNENTTNLTTTFTAGGTSGTYNNTIVFSASGGKYKAYATPTVSAATNLSITIDGSGQAITPGEKINLSALATTNNNQDVSKSTSFAWSLQSGGIGTLQTQSNNLALFTAGNKTGTYKVSVVGKYENATASATGYIYIVDINEKTEWHISPRPISHTNTWVGEKTRMQFVIKIKVGSKWVTRWGEDVKATISDGSVGEVSSYRTNDSKHRFVLNPYKEGCYPFLIRGYLERFGKTYSTYVGFNIASNNQNSAYYKYQPNLGDSVLQYQQLRKNPQNELTLLRRDQYGTEYSWYNWIYSGNNMKTTWILNDVRIGTLTPHYNTAYLNSSQAEYGFYKKAITTKVTFRGQTKTENWDIWVYSDSDFANKKYKLPDSIPSKITVRPNSIFANIHKGYEIIGWDAPAYSSYQYSITDYNKNIVELINSEPNIVFKAIGKPGFYKNAITIKNKSSVPADPLAKSIDLVIDSNCSIDLCTSGIGGGNITNNDEITEGKLGPKNELGGIISPLFKFFESFGSTNTATAASLAMAVGLALAQMLASLNNVSQAIGWFNYAKQNLFYWFGITKSPQRWGIVYDDKTKKPVPYAKVMLYSWPDNELRKTVIANNLGEFGFLIPKGKYIIMASAPGYQLSSSQQKQLHAPFLEKRSDGYYDNIYYTGEVISVNSNKQGKSIMNISIPMSQLIQKTSKQQFLHYLHLFLKFINKIRIPLLLIGTILNILTIAYRGTILDFVTIGLYLIMWIIEAYHFFYKSRAAGKVVDASNDKPLDLVLIRLLDKKTNRLVDTTVTDQEGKFMLNANPGDYIIKINKRGKKEYLSDTLKVKSLRSLTGLKFAI